MSGAAGSSQWMYASGYEVDQSLRFNQSRGSTLVSVPKQAPTSTTIATWSFWIKKTEDVADNEQSVFNSRHSNGGAGFVNCEFHYDNYENSLMFSVNHSGGNACLLITKRQFTDPNAWYHVVIAYDSTQGTAANRVNIYINGVKETEFHTETYPDQNRVLNRWGAYTEGSAIPNNIGSNARTSNRAYFDGYLAEFHYVDGQQLTQASFGYTGTTGQWLPKEYDGTHGNNGYYLPFKNDYTVEGFNTVVYKGASTNRYIGGVGFQPDFVWTKDRLQTTGHSLTNSVAGVYKSLFSEDTSSAEDVGGNLISFDSDGFTVNSGSNRAGGDGDSFVAWCWDMGTNTATGFGAVEYKGNNSDLGITITGVGFQPDLVWIKKRNADESHNLEDALRGPGKEMRPDVNNAEQDLFGQFGIETFDSDGFTIFENGSRTNASNTYIAWCWDMGNTSVTNTEGDIDVTLMANPTYGQSMLKWTGNGTLGHGLSAAPEMIIVKPVDVAGSWWVWHHGLSNTSQGYLQLDSDNGEATNASLWDNASPVTSTTINVNTAYLNNATDNYIAYCFDSITGYSKVGSYTGNATSGLTITTGFRPAFLLVKETGQNGENWYMFDSTREPLGELQIALKADVNNAEASNSAKKVEFTSTGFKLNSTNGALNRNNGSYIYYAVAGGKDSSSTYNEDGNIDSRVKASTTYGQSLVHYKGTAASSNTVGHGLSAAPEMMIVRCRSAANAWAIYHKDIGNTHLLEFSTAAKADNDAFWNDTTPTSSVFTIGSHNQVNTTEDFMAWCFHSVTGYSKIGAFTGNGDSRSTAITITCGFRPAFFMYKVADASSNRDWYIVDDTRSNPIYRFSSPNINNADRGEAGKITFTSTGIDITTNDDELNADGKVTVYMIFANKREFSLFSDASGNGNHLVSENGTITESDIMLDSPNNNFATANPLAIWGWTDNTGVCALSNGNLHVNATSNQVQMAKVNFLLTGKTYWEVIPLTQKYQVFGLGEEFYDGQSGLSDGAGGAKDGLNVYVNEGTEYTSFRTGGSITNTNISGSFPITPNDVVQFAYDADTGKIWFARNNIWYGSGDPAGGNNPVATFPAASRGGMMPAGTDYSTSAGFVWNFGQDSSFGGIKIPQGNADGGGIGDFFFEPPTGFKAVCTKNLPAPAIASPEEHFNIVLYTGNANAQAISGVGFQPDWVWLKRRSSVQNSNVFDSVRGTNKTLATNSTDAEGSVSQFLNSFDSDGFTVGSAGNVSANGETNVAWNWYAPTAFSNDASATSVGSVDSSGKVNTTAGFSIVSYVGTSGPDTIAHGLSAAPEMIIVKNRSADGQEWLVYHHGNTSAPETDYLRLDDAQATADNTFWNDTAPTSTVFSVGDSQPVNSSHGNSYIAYCFHSVEGYSKVGNYSGNGNADGTFVFTGFKPAYVLCKDTASANGWQIIDNKRSAFNTTTERLLANLNNAEQTNVTPYDFVSNGFKVRTSDSSFNSDDVNYVYLAFAETPFKTSNAR